MTDQKLQEELRRRFNPDGSELRRLQLKLLEMLRFIDDLCRKNGINYWLSSGTLIGAVRHEGFIPWDDDVDIEMLPEDLKLFVEAFNNLKQDRYALQSHSTDPEFPFAFVKLRDLHSHIEEHTTEDRYFRYRGCYIDIFTITPSFSKKIHRLGCKILGTAYTYYCRHHDSAAGRGIRFLALEIVIPLLRTVNGLFPGDRLRHTMPSYFSAMRDRKDLFPLSEVMFEGFRFPAPGNTDGYLSKMYGDYMNLPDLDKIKPHSTKVILDAE